MKKYKIVVRGGYGLTNFGDDALLKSIHEDYLNDFSKQELGYSSTPAKYLSNDIGDYPHMPLDINYDKLTQLLIYGGGTQFYSFNKKRSFFNRIFLNLPLFFSPRQLRNKIKRVWRRRKDTLARTNPSELNKIALGIGVGPFLPDSDPVIEERVASLFREMKFVAVRDIYSYKKCQEWGVKNFQLYADLCFKMKHEKFFKRNEGIGINKVGIIVRDWDKTDAGRLYSEEISNVAQKLREQGFVVNFIVFAKERDKNWLKLLTTKKEDLLVWDPDDYKIDAFFEKLYSFDTFITARYHGAVFAAMLGKPFITIEVEQKLAMFQGLFENCSYNWTIPFDGDELLNHVRSIDKNYTAFSEEIVRKAKIQRELASKMKEDLDLNLIILLDK